MFRTYLALGALLVVLFGYGQREHWSIYGTNATEAPRGVRAGTGGITRHK
jgi:hypothetical protein